MFKKKSRPKEEYVKVMIGSGSSSTFVSVKKGEKVLIGSGLSSMIIRAGETVSIDEEAEKRFPTSPKQKVKSIFRK